MTINLPLKFLDTLYCSDNTDIKIKSIIKKRFLEIGIINYPKITSFKEACSMLGYDESDIIKPNYDTKHQAFIKLSTVIESLNEGWKPDVNDNSQKKWYNRFKIENGLFVFCDTYFLYTYWYMTVPSAHYLKDEQTAIYCKDNFFELYKEYYM